MNDIQKQLVSEISRASLELNSNELIYTFDWSFLLPGQSLTISGKMLHNQYAIPDNYGTKDLEKLVEIRFLEQVYESEQDPITLEKTIKFIIIGT